ncbi:hypothetical protein [Nocardia paucivorans]|uniref:hypothetical protein n=1 Tax=Nocardia paucivorans TaxID=114259 RepID=UPI0002E21BAF|nr:hypothetical protein [Nocardia paucivorans]
MHIQRAMVGIALIGLAVGATTAMAAPARAETMARSQYVAMDCYGVSPNLVDLPYNGGGSVVTRTDAPGLFTFTSNSRSVFGYTTDARIEWRNLDNGRTGVHRVGYRHGLKETDGYQLYEVNSGPGRVRLTISAVNHGLLALPAPVCSGDITV